VPDDAEVFARLQQRCRGGGTKSVAWGARCGGIGHANFQIITSICEYGRKLLISLLSTAKKATAKADRYSFVIYLTILKNF
jgi:hypothetical protein